MNHKDKGSEIISAILHLKIAEEYMADFIRQRPKTAFAVLFRNYIVKIKWIFKDMLSATFTTPEVSAGIRKEIESDTLVIPALIEKIALLPIESRDTLENIVDELLKGGKINVTDKRETND